MRSLLVPFVFALVFAETLGQINWWCHYGEAEICDAYGWCGYYGKSMAQAYPPIRSCCVKLNNYRGICCTKLRYDSPECTNWSRR